MPLKTCRDDAQDTPIDTSCSGPGIQAALPHGWLRAALDTDKYKGSNQVISIRENPDLTG